MTTYVNLPVGTTHEQIVQAIADARALGDGDIIVSMAEMSMSAEEFLGDKWAKVLVDSINLEAMYADDDPSSSPMDDEGGLAYFDRYIAGDR